MIERLHGTIRQRNKIVRGLDDENTAQTMMDGMQIYYNFIRPHMALDGKTPAQQEYFWFRKRKLVIHD